MNSTRECSWGRFPTCRPLIYYDDIRSQEWLVAYEEMRMTRELFPEGGRLTPRNIISKEIQS